MLSNLQSSCEDNRRNCIHASRRTWRNYVPKMDFLIMYRKICQYNIKLLICLLKKSRVTSANYNTNKKKFTSTFIIKKTTNLIIIIIEFILLLSSLSTSDSDWLLLYASMIQALSFFFILFLLIHEIIFRFLFLRFLAMRRGRDVVCEF